MQALDLNNVLTSIEQVQDHGYQSQVL